MEGLLEIEGRLVGGRESIDIFLCIKLMIEYSFVFFPNHIIRENKMFFYHFLNHHPKGEEGQQDKPNEGVWQFQNIQR